MTPLMGNGKVVIPSANVRGAAMQQERKNEKDERCSRHFRHQREGALASGVTLPARNSIDATRVRFASASFSHDALPIDYVEPDRPVCSARLLRTVLERRMSFDTVLLDFDGTITRIDTVDRLLERFALPEWMQIEAEWQSGKIGARECLHRQTALLRAEPAALDELIDSVPIDPERRVWCS